MRSLSGKLMLSMWLISLLGIIAVLTLARWSFVQGASGIESRARIAILAADLEACHASFDGWPRDIDRACRLEQSGRGLRWALIDERKNVISRSGNGSYSSLKNTQRLAIGGATAYLVYEELNGKSNDSRPPGRHDEIPDLQEPVSPLIALTRTLFWGGALTSLASLVVGWLLARTITRPVRELTAATDAVAQGDLSQRVAVDTDDELGALAQSFNQMSSDLARSNQLRSQMTADIAHDLRTPVSVIMGHAEAVKDGVLSADETIHIIHDEALRLNRLIDDLRTLTLADAGELPLTLRLSSVLELLQRTQAAHLPQAIGRNVDLVVDAAEPLPMLTIDPDRMAQVLNNLVSNALRYTPDGGTVTLGAWQAADQLLITVCDTGSGIAADQLPYIFDRFYRADTSRHGGNSGLGLAIAKSIVAQHTGTITVASTDQKGTTFTITLPIGKNDDSDLNKQK